MEDVCEFCQAVGETTPVEDPNVGIVFHLCDDCKAVAEVGV